MVDQTRSNTVSTGYGARHVPGTVILGITCHGSSAMHAAEELVAMRQEIMQLLCQQLDALDSPLGLSDARLRECYERQARVQELREKMQAVSNAIVEPESARHE